MIEIVEVKKKKQMKQFVKFPIKLYKGSKCYVPSFNGDEMEFTNPKKNHAAEGCDIKCFLAYKDGVLAGRIAGVIVYKSNILHDQKCVRFSRFDFVDDVEVAKELLKAVEDFGREKGMTMMHGPWGLNDTDKEGMLTFGFDKISTFATYYNFEYYPKTLEKLGFEKESEWVEYGFDFSKFDERYEKIANAVLKKFDVEEIADKMSLKKIVKLYGDSFFDCYNMAYKDLDNFIEIKGNTRKNVLSLFATALNKKYVSIIVERKSRKVVAFVIAMPALGKIVQKHKGSLLRSLFPLYFEIRKPKNLEFALIGVDPKYRMTGVNAISIMRIWKNMLKHKIKSVVSNPMLTTNIKVLSLLDGIPHELIKRRQTFKKDIL